MPTIENRRHSKPEYLRFVEADSPYRNTRLVEVRSVSSDVILGTIRWFGRWRQYTFWPDGGTTFNPACMKQIAARCLEMSRDHTAKLQRQHEAANGLVDGEEEEK